MNEEFTGVENAPVAGEQSELYEQNYYNDEQDVIDTSQPETEDITTGVEEPAVAGQEEEGAVEDRVEKAFAKRLAQEREKIRRELEEEFNRRFAQMSYQQTIPQQTTPQQTTPSLEEQANELAEQLMITPEAAKRLLQQQQQLQELATQFYIMQDNSEKIRAQQAVEERRKTNPYLPLFDERKVASYRLRYYNRYGIMPSWEDAYDYYVADAVKSGELLRTAEQMAVQQITGRNRVNTQVGRGSQPQKRDIWALSDEEFEKLKEIAKQGQLKEI